MSCRREHVEVPTNVMPSILAGRLFVTRRKGRDGWTIHYRLEYVFFFL